MAQLSTIFGQVVYFFSPQALDARIQPISTAGDKQQEVSGSSKQPSQTKPLWNTLEFKFYFIVLFTAVPLMIKTAMDASNETNPNFYKFGGWLSQGWINGRLVDNSDAQYRFFRDNMALLFELMLAHIVVKKLALYFLHVPRLTFDFWFGLIFLVAAHGVNCLRILTHMMLLFSIAHIFRNHRRIAQTLTWVYGVGSLFFNDRYRTYPFGNILSILSPLDGAFTGIIARWDVFYNFTLLRLLSYNLDYLERWDNIKHGSNNRAQQPAETSNREGTAARTTTTTNSTFNDKETQVLGERARYTVPHPIEEYNIFRFVTYVTYTPLFIAGPIITFNDFIYQSKHTLPSINRRRIAIYAVRLVMVILLMEFILHYAYVVAVSKSKAWEGDTPFQISMIGLLNLNIIWLKLLIPWRLFRLWALLDGIDTPENMIRIVDNNYSALAFWRAWHRSYNKWIIRYIYIPLGGSKSRILSSLAVFSFVAIWHDIQLKLLLWGWLIVFFLLPEIFLTKAFQPYKNRWWFRHACALGGVCNIWMMMIANLFGFCLGSDGTILLLREIFLTSSGLLFFVIASACLFVGVQLMFEYREEEKRHGIYLKC